MSSFTPEQMEEMRRLFDEWLRQSDQAVLIRQLQTVLADAGLLP